jgi:hypothetical protein
VRQGETRKAFDARILDETNRGVKLCYKCGVEKPLSEFSPNKTKKNGTHNQCKQCTAAGMTARKAKDPEGLRTRKAESYIRGRAKDPEKFRAQAIANKAARNARKAKDPEGYRARETASTATRKARDPKGSEQRRAKPPTAVGPIYAEADPNHGPRPRS